MPEGVGYATKGQLARAMLERAFEAGVPAAWVVGGEAYDKDEGLRRWLEARGRPYVLSVGRADRLLPAAKTVLEPLPTWEREQVSAWNGGARAYEWAYGPLRHEAATGRMEWLLVRRSAAHPDEYTYYRAYGPRKTSLVELGQVAAAGWTILDGLKRAKGEVGLDQYEVRRWEAWHRHVTLCLLAHAALEVARTEQP